MSTRATYEFIDEYNSFTVYKHCDGYPEGALQWIANALPWAWKLPRFEACDFAAAFIAGNKSKDGGGVYFTEGKESHADTEYHYTIKCINGVIYVNIHRYYEDVHEFNSLDYLLNKYAPNRLWIK
jgi:hypothetical protein